jgi:hypothetical protein
LARPGAERVPNRAVCWTTSNYRQSHPETYCDRMSGRKPHLVITNSLFFLSLFPIFFIRVFHIPRKGGGGQTKKLTKQSALIGVQAESIMKSGGLVHDAIMVKLIVGELSKRGWVETRGNMASGLCLTGPLSVISKPGAPAASDCPSASFLLDGFPRTQSQAKSLDEEVRMNLVCGPFLSGIWG